LYLLVFRKSGIFNSGIGNVNYSKVIECSRDNEGLHPTMKPIELVEKALINSSKQDDIVLDLFLGSGSTLIACEKTGRICYGMELDPKYVDVIVQRYVDYTGNEEIKLNGETIIWKKTQK
jgi:DNA modification methylase